MTGSSWLPSELGILRALLVRGRSYDLIAWALPRHTARAIEEKARAVGWAPNVKGKTLVTVRKGVVRYRSIGWTPTRAGYMRRVRKLSPITARC